MKVRDGQNDFSGGMNDRLSPERLGENQYAEGKNVEFRYGGIRSRRGSWRIRGKLFDNTANLGDVEITSFHVCRTTDAELQPQFVFAAVEQDDSETFIRRCSSIGSQSYLSVMQTPTRLVGRQNIRFVQGYDYLYLLRDGEAPWRWDLQATGGWEVVPDGTSGAVPVARDGVYAYNRMWLIEGDDTVIASDLLDENWDRVDNEFRVEQGDGTRLVALHPFGGGSLLAFKERGVALIAGANNFVSSSDMTLEFIATTTGCVSKDTVVTVGADVFFLGREGVWTVRQTTEQNAQLISIPLSDPIYNLIQDINWNSASKCSAVLFDNYYVLAVPVGSSTNSNRMLVYDLLARTWVGYWEIDDGTGEPVEIAKIESATINGRSRLVASEVDGGISYLLTDEYQDRVGSASFEGVSDLRTELSSGVRSEFTDGYIEFKFQTIGSSELASGYSIQFIDGPNQIRIAWLTNSLYRVTFMGCTFTISRDRYRIYGAKWYTFRFAFNETADPGFNTVVFYINDELVGEYKYASVSAYPGITDPSPFWVGAYSPFELTERQIYFDYIDIGTVRKSSSSASNPHRIFMGFHNDGTDDLYAQYYYGANNDYDDVLIVNTNVDYIPVNGSSFGDYEDVADARADIESVIKTRAFSFGDLFTLKSTLRGECKFSHGQPSLTMDIENDTPFDSEVATSMNAKTFSLTDYEVYGVAAWDATNVNDDFHTPFREDYAPITLGFQMGSNGLTLDKFREHTELFSSLAVFGWVQFVLTNTQGYIRYNGLRMMAEARMLEQDRGNNGY